MLTYCTNIHPGESWCDVRRNLEGHFLEVKRRFSPDASFPIGLRLSARAASEIDDAEARRFHGWCDENGCFPLSVNGFPHGAFHGVGVKEKVYLPDWRDPERLAYTCRLADLLAGWLPDGVRGSISTVPVAFGPAFDAADWPGVRAHVRAAIAHLDGIRQAGGPSIGLAFEPEPRCVLETTSDAIAFLEGLAVADDRRDLVGVCFDCCHQAVEFEEPSESLRRLADAGIPVLKVQISSSLRALPHELDALAAFAEPTYLHQVVGRWRDGSLSRHDDLPVFLATLDAERRRRLVECRVHFHVPIFSEHLGPCGTTQFFLEQVLALLDPGVPLEVETYSWNVLPAALRGAELADDIVRELRWVAQQRRTAT